ncbi:PREDICTED: uncharacterized protein LOC104820603 [Tarenaya hassleriana]|uniref:uncharacterized protein LOC104820603 n=1 Tax=Tarenaya hassleriana TaxID=28532 RepID=UPI00053C62CA|nr:PREDICTED: uncharacterized protein LOC104820603 [Tarenaya hassleriana]XP_010549424.1 PREDICTED: uncharacterized protein LOC104820603 [Tarenaya hassleriana]
MEGLGGLGFSSMSSGARKKRSNTLRRPWSEPQLHDGSSLSSTPTSDNNVNKIEERENVESDEGSTNGSFRGSNQDGPGGGFNVPTGNHKASSNGSEQQAGSWAENTVKKVKLKVGGLTKTLDANSASGVVSTESSRVSSDASQLRQMGQDTFEDRSTKFRGISWNSVRKTDSSNVRASSGGNEINVYQPIRKSNRISKRRVLGEEELDGTEDYDDEEIRFLRRVKMAKVLSLDDDDDNDDDEEGRSKKHKKLSNVMKRDAEGLPGKPGKRNKTGRLSDDIDYVEDKEEGDEELEAVSDVGPGNKKTTVTTRQRSGFSRNLIEFPDGLPPAPPRRRKETPLEVEQQLKKAEAAQRRKLQVEKAARESEAEAIRKILGQDSSRKKREDKIKKRQEEKAKEKAANAIARQSETVKWVMGPSGTVITFPDEVGLPSIFDSRPHSYPPPREKCVGPSCKNPYKYRDSKSNLPLCSLQCYKSIKG